MEAIFNVVFVAFTSGRRHRICKAINIKSQNNEQGETMPYVTIKKQYTSCFANSVSSTRSKYLCFE